MDAITSTKTILQDVLSLSDTDVTFSGPCKSDREDQLTDRLRPPLEIDISVAQSILHTAWKRYHSKLYNDIICLE